MSRRGAGEEGFVLIAAIWFVALAALVAIVISTWMSRSLDLATRLQDRLAAHQALFDAQNEIEYRLVSGFLSARGLELPADDERALASAPEAVFGYQFGTDTRYIALDNRPYRLGGAVVRLQDDRGLITLNHPGPLPLGGLLASYGIARGDRDVLIDRLLDYMGNSTFQRLNGATARDYEEAGRAPPRGALLLTPWEALRVLSWDDYPALWRSPGGLSDFTTTGDAVQLNPLTAPAEVLATLPGMNQTAVQRLLQYRQTHVLQSLDDVDRVTGAAVGIDPMAVMFFPADSLDVTIAAKEEPLARRLRLELTPTGKAPFRVDYVVARPTDADARAAIADPKQLAEFPQVKPPQPFGNSKPNSVAQ